MTASESTAHKITMDPKNTSMPAGFLTQQMEWREALADAVTTKDFDALQRLEKATRNAAKDMLAEIATLLDQRQDYAQAAEALRKYRFLEKFQADIDDAYEHIE